MASCPLMTLSRTFKLLELSAQLTILLDMGDSVLVRVVAVLEQITTLTTVE